MKIRTNELTGAALDWAVAKCEGILDPVHGEPQPRVVFYSDQWDRYMRLNPPPQVYYSDRYEPSTDWAQGGALIEREGIGFFCNRTAAIGARFTPDAGADWRAFALNKLGVHYYGPTPLIAAMRCLVTSKLGDEVEIPEELTCLLTPKNG